MDNIGKLNAAIYRTLQSILSLKLKNVPIRSGQYDFFYVISQNEGITQKELSEILFVDKSTTAKAVKSLIAEGYVKKEPYAEDKRFVQLYLTNKGAKLKPNVEETFASLIDVSTKNLSSANAKTAVTLLQDILDGLVKEKTTLSSKNI